jgi:predicted membrane channel-forming protein YqfA (hemolysin III family)
MTRGWITLVIVGVFVAVGLMIFAQMAVISALITGVVTSTVGVIAFVLVAGLTNTKS